MQRVISGRPTDGPAKDLPSLAVLASVAVSVLLVAMASQAFTHDVGGMAAIWPANAIVIAIMLRRGAAQWPLLLIAGLAGNIAADVVAGDTIITTIQFTVCNSVEALVCAGLMRRFAGPAIDLSQKDHLLLFLLVAGGLAPLVSALGNAFAMSVRGEASFLISLTRRYARDALGLLTVTPVLMALTPQTISDLFRRVRSRRGRASITVLPLALLVVFGQDRIPLLFLVPTALILVAFELNIAGAALAMLATSVVAVGMTLTGHGPMAVFRTGLSDRLTILEIFLATMALAVLPVAAALTRRERLETTLRDTSQKLVEALAEANASEFRYRTIAESATDVISRTGIDGRFIYLSPSITDVMGLQAEDLIGHSLIPHMHPDDVETSLAAYRRIISGERIDKSPILYRARHRDGRWVWLECNPTLVRDAKGAPTEFIDITRNVSARVRLEAELRAARDAAEAAVAVKAEFLANMSHEIRTPLTAILGFASLLADRSDLDEAARTYVSRIVGAGSVLRSVVNDVLDFSKLEAGQVELRPTPVSPAGVLRETLLTFSHQAEAKALTLTFQDDGGLPPCLLIDAERLRQILFNLLSNAIKFTDTGSVVLAATYAAKSQQLSVHIEDTGAGLTRAQQRRLFQRFSQVDGSSTRRHGGTGLGLAICKGLAEAMGGQIGVRSRPGQGSLFHFSIVAPTAIALLATARDEAPVSFDGVRILVADDNPTNRELVRAMLSPLGAELTEVAGGADAVEAARWAPYDIILMDMRMPGVDGRTATRRIRQTVGPNQDIPILAFSAETMPGDIASAATCFDGVVRKPLVFDDLISTLAQHLQLDTEASSSLEAPDAICL